MRALCAMPLNKMRTLTIIVLLSTTIASQAQSVRLEKARFLTYTQNKTWLTTVQSFNESAQWAAISERFLFRANNNSPVDSIQYSPLIVINGVPLNVPSDLTDANTEVILSLLNENSIEQIEILDKISEPWTFCKPFSGVIILRVDKIADKKLSKLKL
jgi:hypothetical protein